MVLVLRGGLWVSAKGSMGRGVCPRVGGSVDDGSGGHGSGRGESLLFVEMFMCVLGKEEEVEEQGEVEEEEEEGEEAQKVRAILFLKVGLTSCSTRSLRNTTTRPNFGAMSIY